MSAQLYVVLFPALTPTDAAEIATIRRQHDPQASLIAPHITLAFARPESEAPLLTARCRAAAERQGPLPIRLRGLAIERGRVGGGHFLYLLAEEPSALSALHACLDPQPDEKFRPHLTIGRFDDHAAAERARARLRIAPIEAAADALVMLALDAGRLCERARFAFAR